MMSSGWAQVEGSVPQPGSQTAVSIDADGTFIFIGREGNAIKVLSKNYRIRGTPDPRIESVHYEEPY